MARTTYFTHGTRNEQFLLQNLVEEHLKMFGMDILYCPREIMHTDGVFNEEVIGEFNDAYIIEAYLENPEGFQGSGDLLTKFGVAQSDEITMVISAQRFSDLISQFLLLDKDYLAPERPQEGDLIYFPLTSNYFEIKFVEHEEPFYQLGKGYVYKLKAELFEYSDEQGDVFDSDEDLVDYGYTVKHYYLPINGITATGNATAEIVATEQIGLAIPSQSFAQYLAGITPIIGPFAAGEEIYQREIDPNTGAESEIARGIVGSWSGNTIVISEMISGSFVYMPNDPGYNTGNYELIGTNTDYTDGTLSVYGQRAKLTEAPVSTGGAIDQIYITNNGTKYNEAPTVTISSTGNGTGATATAYLANVTLSGGSPITQATIRATVKEGQIRSVQIVDGGSGYDEDRVSLVVSDPDGNAVKATLTPTFTNGTLTAINIVNGGSGYRSVRLVDVTNGGEGYISATTTTTFGAAPAGITGAFTVPETVTGGTTGATANMVEWDAGEGWVKLKSPTGTFTVGEVIVGSESGATIVLDSRDEQATADPKYSESVTFETQADDILDFSEGNPFGIAGNL